MSYPQQQNFFMPPEWHPHECCWMQWPHEIPYKNSYKEIESWSHFDFEKGRITWAKVAKAISNFEKVNMIIHPQDIEIAKKYLDNSINIYEFENDDCWARDSGATFLLDNQNKLGGVDWEFNGWGKFSPHDSDNKIAKFMIDKSSAKYFKSSMILEGGSIHVNGRGTLITTEQCLLNKNRNPHLNKKEIEDNLKKYLNIKKIIWLKHGTDEGTDGHVDNIACFVDERKVLALACKDKEDPFYDKINENLEILKNSVGADGHQLEIIEMEMSYKRLIPNDDEPSSYINFYIANNGIVMPSFNDKKADENAQSVIKSLFPKRKIQAINGIDISLGGGNMHCITQQQPISI